MLFYYDIDKFKKSIHQINYLKGIIQHKDDVEYTYNVGIEEIVFYSEDDAMTLVQYITNLRNIAYFWDSLDKAPSYIFREANKVYFVRVNHRIFILAKFGLPKNMAQLMKEEVSKEVREWCCEMF